MTPAEEKKVLDALLAQLDGTRPNVLASATVSNLLWVALFALFLVIFLNTGRKDGAGMFVAAIVGVLIGAATGIAMVSRQAQLRWPTLRGHVDRASVVARIQELER